MAGNFLNKLLKFLPQLLISVCLTISVVESLISVAQANEKSNFDDILDLPEQNQSHRKGRCKSTKPPYLLLL